jgi:uncharacterized protein YkwD
MSTPRRHASKTPDERPGRERRQLGRRLWAAGAVGALGVATGLIVATADRAETPPADSASKPYMNDSPVRAHDATSRSASRSGEPSPASPPVAEAPAGASPARRVPVDTATTAPSDPAGAPAAAAAPAPGAAAAPAAAPSHVEPAAPPQPASAPQPDPAKALAADIVTLTNTERRNAGMPGLSVSTCATSQAAQRSATLVAEGRFEHDPLEPIQSACSAHAVGENISLGYPTAQATVDGWMNSSGHHDNILRATFTSIGVGCTSGPDGWLCSQVFLG